MGCRRYAKAEHGAEGMSVDLTLPAWAERYIRIWRERLLLEHWAIKAYINLCVHDDPEARGGCTADSHRNTANIALRADLEDEKEWRQTIIHEMVHVAHAQIDHAIECVIIPELPIEAQELAKNAYRQHMESFVDLLAITLYRASCEADYPDEKG